MPLKDRIRKTTDQARALHARLKGARIKTVSTAQNIPVLAKKVHTYRKIRRTPTGFSFVLSDHIGGIRPDHWDSLVAGQTTCLSRAFLETLRDAGPEGLTGHYVLIYRGETPVVAMACQSLYVSAGALPAHHEDETPLQEARDKSLQRLKQRVLVCGNLLGWGPQGVAFAQGEDPNELWPAVAEALYRIRRADKLFGETGLVMIKDLTDDHHAAVSSLEAFRYKALETEPNMVLELNSAWQNFDEYLAAMKSDYRSSIKKQMRDIDAAGLVVETLDAASIAARKHDIHGLYMEVHEKQKMRLVTISPDWIPALAQRFAQDFRCTVIRRLSDDKLLGFITTLKDADGAIGYYIGFNKQAAEQGMPLYLRLLYALVADAIQLRANWVSLGRTALAPKATLGAKPQAMRCLLRHRIPAMNLVVGALLRGVPEPAQPPERNPFKPVKVDTSKI